MKTFASVVVVLVSLGSAGFAAQPEPTLFEAFATSPNTITKFSREVGAIDNASFRDISGTPITERIPAVTTLESRGY